MSWIETSVRRPVTTLMVYAGVLLFGIISLYLLSQELFPPISYPQLSVITPYENAAPEEIETLITKPIEEAVGGIAGIRKVTSTSKEGLSVVITEFGWNQNMDFASLSVREKIDLIKERLPRDAAEPVVIKYNPFELPVMSLSISSSKRTPVQLRELAKKWFKDEIEKIYGVASASISGGTEEQILVDVDQAKLRAAGVSIVEVSDAVGAANLNYPGGTIKESFYEYLVRTLGEFKHIEEVGQVPIKRENTKESKDPRLAMENEKDPSNRLILLKDVADIERSVKERTSYSRFNLRDNVTVSIQKQGQSNTILIVNAIKKKLQELQERLPNDIHVDILYDQSKFIKSALDGVKDAASQGSILAFITILIFLLDFRSSLMVVTIIPFTILATFTLMYFTHISLNVITLGGIALGVGMLLDYAVVVIENVHRKFRDDPEPDDTKTIVKGTNDVAAAVLSSMLTTIAVFLPIIFVTGIAGQIFKELAWVVVVTNVFSIIIAFTLFPMLLAKYGKMKRGSEDHIAKPKNPVMIWIISFLSFFAKPIHAIEKIYEKVLPAFLKRKWFYLFITFLVFIASLLLMASMDRILLPKIDQGQFMVKIDLPVGSRVIFTDKISMKIEEFLSKLPEVKDVSMVAGSSKGDASKEVLERLGANQAQIIASLKEDRKLSTDQIVQIVRKYFELGEGREAIRPARLSYVLYDNAFKTGDDNDAPIVIDIKGPKLDMLKQLAIKTQESISKVAGVYGAANNIAEPFPETKLIINKDRASYYRLSVVNIAQAANIAMKGIVSSKFKEEGREIDIRVQLKESDRNEFKKLGLLMIHSPLDLDVPLGDFVKFERGKGPSEIRRVSQERTIQVYAKIYGRGLKETIQDIQEIIKNMSVPERYEIKIAGESKEIQESFSSLVFALALSVVLIYMVMAATFESLVQPFVVMFCLPLSMVGVAIALWISQTPISVVVILGIILLGGIAVNNGIVLIDYINQLRSQGIPLVEATIQAGKTRLRPILMTAFSTALGLVPLALGIGEGAKLQAPMAVTVMGGILVATFLTLVVIPAIYIITEETIEKLKR